MDNNTKFERLIKGICNWQDTLLRKELNSLGEQFLMDYQKFLIFGRDYPRVLADFPPVEELLEVLLALERMTSALKKCGDSYLKRHIKIFELYFSLAIALLGGSDETDTAEMIEYRQILIGKIDELPEQNIFRQVFLSAYNRCTSCLEIQRRLLQEVQADEEAEAEILSHIAEEEKVLLGQ